MNPNDNQGQDPMGTPAPVDPANGGAGDQGQPAWNPNQAPEPTPAAGEETPAAPVEPGVGGAPVEEPAPVDPNAPAA